MEARAVVEGDPWAADTRRREIALAGVSASWNLGVMWGVLSWESFEAVIPEDPRFYQRAEGPREQRHV